MSGAASGIKPEKTVSVVRGQLHKFMLIPIMEDHAKFFAAGPVTFVVEGRVLGDSKGGVAERGASIHVFNADQSQEWLRFDCFEKIPHYHYILQADQHNIVWGYDPEANGPMLPWALNALRTRLPGMLRGAGADALADQVERVGFDMAVLDQIEDAMIEADARTRPGTDMLEDGLDWYLRWKQIHPQFNTVD